MTRSDRAMPGSGEKLETAKACAAYLARRLAPTERLAVVTYDDEVRLELTTPCCEVAPASAPKSRGTA